MDWMHGFSLQPANINIQVLPKYEHVLTLTPNKAGDYSLFCNEYCGIMHHTMITKIYVVD
jgi:cytochrome c oxidase subunit 2